MTPLRTIAVTLLALAPSLAAQSDDPDRWLARCRHEGWADRPHACEVRETGMRPTAGALTVDPGMNGAVAVLGWDRDSVAITAKLEAWAGSEADARDLLSGIRIEAKGTSIRATGAEQLRRHGWSVSFEVMVPRHTDLSLETVNGPVSVERVTGTMDLRAQNGPIELIGVGGAVQVHVQNGPLTVELTGTQWEGTGLNAETMNGPVDLEIPEGYNAALETGTVNGPMSVEFPITVTVMGRVSDRISTTLGRGGPRVRVVSTNGPFTLRRAR
jgi:hypothetical protein